MSSEIEFSTIGIDYLNDMMVIERDTYDPPWSMTMMRDSILAAHTRAWGAFSQGKLIGFGILSIILDEAELLSICISPKMQKKGYGRQLLDFLIRQAQKNKAEKLFLEVRQSNDRAIDLYGLRGFNQVSIRKGYYPLSAHYGREDALVFSLDLL
ncbi:ribosomal protein S18-alanine N-acetyltransferase [Thiotrichales bacterium 19S9-12]|nr:ribosomal protein S18-alanine N-acetyltransferase [Thiotrichales bacterium 19S9-11]MCF6811787.1 ribosomal protein S18-alanine N-acetyltransferase [Thiotrichales bacterium 19S9-12]